MMKYCVLLLLLFNCACSSMVNTCPKMNNSHANFACPEQWNEKSAKYHLHQAGIISFADKELPIEGYLILEPEKSKASLTTWSIFGMKMFSIKIFENQIKCDYLQPGLERIPNFVTLAGKSVRRSFLTTPSKEKSCIRREQKILACKQTRHGPLTFIYNPKGLLKKKFLNSANHKWSVTFDDYFRQDQEMYPGTVYYNQKEFEVKLKIKKVDKL